MPYASFLGGFIGASGTKQLRWEKGDQWYTKFWKFGAAWLVGAAASLIARNITVRLTEQQADSIGSDLSMRPDALKSALLKLHAPHPKYSWERIKNGYPSGDERVGKIKSSPHSVVTIAPGPLPETKVMTSLADTQGLASASLAEQQV